MKNQRRIESDGLEAGSWIFVGDYRGNKSAQATGAYEVGQCCLEEIENGRDLEE